MLTFLPSFNTQQRIRFHLRDRLEIEHMSDGVDVYRCIELLDMAFLYDRRLLCGAIRFSFRVEVFLPPHVPTWTGYYTGAGCYSRRAPDSMDRFCWARVVEAPDEEDDGVSNSSSVFTESQHEGAGALPSSASDHSEEELSDFYTYASGSASEYSDL